MTAFYLAPYVGTGRPGHHIRPRVWAPNWTLLIDRRAWGTTQGVALVEADEPQRARGVETIGEDRFEALGPRARQALARALRVREVRGRTLDAVLVSLGHPSVKPTPLEPRRDLLARAWRRWVMPDLAEWYADRGMVPMAGGAALATDTFNRANEDPLAGNWTTQSGLVGFRLGVGGHANAADPDPAGDAGANYNAITWPNDQYSQAALNVGTGNTTGGGVGLGVAVRCAAAAQTFYRICGDHGGSNTFEVLHCKATSFTSMGFRTTSWTNGQLVYLSATGSGTTSVIAKMNGVQLGATFTDSSSPITSGRAGLGYSSTLASIGSGVDFLDDWEGGDFAGGGPVTDGWKILIH